MFYNFDNLKIYYKVLGNSNKRGIPILFLHGWGGNSNSFKIFEEYLKKKIKIILLDFPPFGNSSKLDKPFDVEKYSNLVLFLLNKLKINKVNIVAHSFGGRIALFIASKHGNRVNSMLLTGCAGIKRKEFKIKLKVGLYKFKKFLCKLKLYSLKKLNNSGSYDYRNLNPIMKQTFNKIINFDERYLLKKIKCQTLFVWGKLDKETPFYFTKVFKKHIKNSEIIILENSGHFAYLEKPKVFLLILEKFFEI